MCGLLLLAVAAVFGQTIRHQFVNYDDKQYVYENAQVAQGLTARGVAWAFQCHASNWHPLTWMSHMLDGHLYGLRSGSIRGGPDPVARGDIRVSPENAAALNLAARLLATCPDASIRNGVEAVELARRAVRAAGQQDADLLDTLAAAQAEAGSFSEAVETAERALAIASAQGKSALADAIRRRIQVYRARSSLRGHHRATIGDTIGKAG